MSIPRTLILMGVCGCGKTLTGQMLAQQLGGLFEDADDFHPPPNKAKMTAGTALTDEDRWPWLRLLRERITDMRSHTPCYLLACSALKQSYRDVLRGDDPRGVLEFIHLKGSRELIGSRMAARKGHYMPTTLIDSQFAILEEPHDAITVDVSGTPEEVVADVLHHFE
jgi:carbohydrate kinase (thermoresistant glucokinase family)